MQSCNLTLLAAPPIGILHMSHGSFKRSWKNTEPRWNQKAVVVLPAVWKNFAQARERQIPATYCKAVSRLQVIYRQKVNQIFEREVVTKNNNNNNNIF